MLHGLNLYKKQQPQIIDMYIHKGQSDIYCYSLAYQIGRDYYFLHVIDQKTGFQNVKQTCQNSQDYYVVNSRPGFLTKNLMHIYYTTLLHLNER